MLGRLQSLIRNGLWSLPLAVITPDCIAQIRQPVSPSSSSAPTGVIGKTAMDLILLDQDTFSVPLRNGGVLAGSEHLEVDGRKLFKGDDYTIDYSSGTIFFRKNNLSGKTLRATYRFDSTLQRTDKSVGTGSLQFAGGREGALLLGLGMAERRSDGSVVRSNIYGFRNSFGVGGGNLSGLTVIGEQQKVRSYSLLSADQKQSSMKEGRSQAILQSYQSSLLGGSIELDYRSIDDNFSGFQTFHDAGYDAKHVEQLMKEKGLSRYGFSLSDIGNDSLKLSSRFSAVNDGSEGIVWNSYGLASGNLKASFDHRQVDKGFNRFKDLGETDRGQLAKESGLTREKLTLSYAFGEGESRFDQLSISDPDGNGFSRQSLEFSLGKRGTASFLHQEIDRDFVKVGGVEGFDSGQLSKERGTARRGFEIAFRPSAGMGLRLSENSIKTADAQSEYLARDISIDAGALEFDHTYLGSTGKTQALAALSQKETEQGINRIQDFYGGSKKQNKHDQSVFLQGAGIERTATRASFDLGDKQKAIFSRTQLGDGVGKGSLQALSIEGSSGSLAIKQSTLDESFKHADSLMSFEKAALGSLAGISKSDAEVSINIDQSKKLSASSMNAHQSGSGSASRRKMTYKDKGFDFSFTTRSIDPRFASVGQIVDPEKEFLAQIRGYEQQDMRLRWSVLQGLDLRLDWDRARSESLNEQKLSRNTLLSWAPDKKTRLEYYSAEQRSTSPFDLLFENEIQRWSLSHDFDRFGMLRLSKESIAYDGTRTDLPDSEKRTISYETKLTDSTALKAQQSETLFENGQKESIRSHTLSTSLTDRMGVSVTDTKIDRDGDEPDEVNRNYGIWVDIGNNMRIDYGYKRELNEQTSGQFLSTLSMTPGEMDGISIKGAQYTSRSLGPDKHQAMGNVQIATNKPLEFGDIKDISFRFGADTSRDHYKYVKENRSMAFGARVGQNLFGCEYVSQLSPTGDRAIDRLFRFSTDPSNTAPLKVGISYKVRTLPTEDQLLIRNYSVIARPFKGFEIENQVLTNPEIFKTDALLGSLPQASQVNKWKVGFTGNEEIKFGLSWDEMINERSDTLSRVGGLNLTLFADDPSPVQLFYGLEQGDTPQRRRTAHRYSLRFDQRPSDNQTLSLFIGNVSYQHSRDEGMNVQNWTVRGEYQLRF